MFDAAECMFLYAESSLRVGSGEERTEIDLPVQREAATGYPLVPSSSLKGVLRARARARQARRSFFPCSARSRRATRSFPAVSSFPMLSPCSSRSAP